MSKSVKILNLSISNLSINELLEICKVSIEDNSVSTSRQIVTLNPIILAAALRLKHLFNIISNAFLIVPESIGMKYIGLIFGTNLKRIRGIELMDKLLKLANERSYKVFFIGAKEETLKKAVYNIKIKYPDLIVSGFRNGYFKDDNEQVIISAVSKTQSQILFVGLDTPRQEIWIGDNISKFGVKIVMGVGGSFDCYSGNLKVAPKWVRNLGVEWAYRSIQEPWRLKRIVKIPIFLLKITLLRILR
ncbi:MAG: WecB/TagA/CpsF family glycosyltransferase [bacterium]